MDRRKPLRYTIFTTMPNRVFTLQEVADILRVNRRTIYRLVKGDNERGIKLPATRVGRTWRVAESALRMYLAENANVREGLFRRENYIYIKPRYMTKKKSKK